VKDDPKNKGPGELSGAFVFFKIKQELDAHAELCGGRLISGVGVEVTGRAALEFVALA
jgi:hypothetical protein